MDIRRTIIFDFDGTLTEFRRIDNEIIGEIFKGHKAILLLDRFLWMINGLGIFGNSMFGLKIRLYLYALFAFKETNKYLSVLLRYEEMYIQLSSLVSTDTLNVLKNLKDRYKIIVISNNFFAKGIVIDDTKVEYAYKKRKIFKEKLKENNVVYIVGDNLFDDYMNSKHIPFVYVGNSMVMRAIMKINIFKKTVRIKKIKDIEDVV